MRHIPIRKFFGEEFVDVAPAAAPRSGHFDFADEGEDNDRIAFEAKVEEELRSLRQWDVL